MTVRCHSPYEILAIARVGSTALAVVDTTRRPKRYYVGPLKHGEPADDSDDRFFLRYENAVAELERLERESRS